MILKSPTSRLSLVNLFADFILNQIPSDEETIIQVVDCLNFYVIKGKTTHVEPLNIGKLKDEFNIKFENLIDRTFENFASTGYSNDTSPTAKSPPNICLNVNFDTKTDIAQDKYMFQIFNENGQYGYADGGNNPGNIISSGFRKVIPNMGLERDQHKGNMVVVFNVQFPEKLTEEQIKTLREIL